jgi:hypothetical protein
VTEYAEYSVSEKEDIFGDSNKLEYHMHQWWMTQRVIFCCTVNAWSNTDAVCHSTVLCVCEDCYMPSLQISRQEETGLFHGLQEVLIEYHPNFCVGFM